MSKELKEKLSKRLQEMKLAATEEKREDVENKETEETKMTKETVTIVEEKDLIVVEERPIVPTLAITLEEAKERIRLLKTFVAEMMVQGQDFGLIPGCPKPTLLKPGAEKLCDIFGFSKHLEVTQRLEDWDRGVFHYEVKVTLISKRTGVIEAEGIGSCNTKEKKYVKQDPYSLINTILKMAKKRALVDAVLSATRSSDLFTQDMEDLKDMIASNPSPDPITKPQTMKIKMLGKELNFSKEDAISLLEKDYGVTCTSELTKKQATQLIQQLLSIQEAS